MVRSYRPPWIGELPTHNELTHVRLSLLLRELSPTVHGGGAMPQNPAPVTTIKKISKVTPITPSVLYKMMEFCFFLSSFIFPFFFPPDFLLNSPFDPFQILFVSKENHFCVFPVSGYRITSTRVLCLGPGAHLAPRNGTYQFLSSQSLPYLWLGGGYPSISV